ncbi:site-specific DNA-methyltransferase [Candidatus Corynebacterium faecigallinarum]|uniref:site-specific DNA-methyltransferase n=1 Tax=Candidatus Corynebacterium faecigallinarum TaxID=2838528 RepID=UPI003FD20F14
MIEEIHETPSTTPNFQTELAAQLAELMPEVIADGKVDVEKLKELLDGDAADTSERFGLFWPGKKRALRAAQEPTTATLRTDFENSKDWGTTKNVFIEGDNLEVLKILQKHYHAKIKMIYIDPPYNTGKDFVYPDNYKEGLDTYLEWTRQVNEEGKKLSTNADTEGRYHSNWLNMMYPRLKLARNLLSQQGVLFISIGQHEASNLARLAIEVFGEQNFLGLIPRVAKTTSDSGKFFAPSTDFLVAVARSSKDRVPFKMALSRKDVDAYSQSDPRGQYKRVGFYQASLTLERSRNARYYLDAPDGSKIIPPEGKRWRTVRETFDEFVDRDEIEFREVKNSPLLDQDGQKSKWNVYTKQYLDRRMTEGRTPRDFLAEFPNNLGTKRIKDLDIPFDFPKPTELIRFLIDIVGVEDNDLVLDFFSGSAATADAVLQANADDGGGRRHIQVQLPEPCTEGSVAISQGYKTIADLGRKRIDLAGERIKAELDSQLTDRDEPLDIGYRTYKLADTNFTKWKQSSDVDLNQLEQHLLDLRDSSSADEASADDLLSEILLKQGYSLTEQIAPVDVAGLDLRSVGDGIVLAYLDEHVKPTLEQLRAVVDEDPARLIVLEDAFQGDDQLKTNLSQLCKSKGIELWTA